MNKKGYTLPELIILVVVLGVATLITVTSVSYAFDDGLEETYNQEVNYILRKAETYGNSVLEDVKNSAITITVEKLIEKQFLVGDENGLILDPRNEAEDLNDMRIKITYDESSGKAKAEVVE